ncbi:adenosylcobinamide-GDP ribazoletransferase [uncultured Methanobrevibacter sp.]|uniref:adenosylcobinamide-GDP ribazoletransferase n=1 Tax=uncultured Methanobrevibacter sp. TaxID=253161 RepID=UPI0025E5C91B|nr:adenosylcobinamide-GDP ribazoletransferase [uncultured Methanobrevibacter sp.]
MTDNMDNDLSKNKDEYYDDEGKNSSFIRSLLGLVSFSTIIPLGVYTSIESVVSLTWIWPLLDVILGLFAVGVSYLLLNYFHFPSILIAVIIYGFFTIITGYNHIDGLLDFADGIMVHGDKKRKIEVMRDSILGTSAISTMVIVAFITVVSISAVIDKNILWAILIAEMSSKLSLVTTCICSKPSSDGIGKYFIESMDVPKFVASLLICGIIGYGLLGFLGVFGVIGGVFSGSLIALISKRNFEVATGDVLGASVEIGRVFSLLFLVLAIYF